MQPAVFPSPPPPPPFLSYAHVKECGGCLRGSMQARRLMADIC